MLPLSNFVTFIAAALLASPAVAQQTAWGQCGGIGWTGATTCVSGYVCTYQGAYYSQCIPGTATTTAKPTTLTTVTTGGTTTTKTSRAATTTAGSSTGPGATLQAGYYWIRAVEAPNFHYYLQTSPSNTAGPALITSYTTAGQFAIVSGQLVMLTSSSTTSPTLLYANVAVRNGTERTLAVSFSATKNTYGTFTWSGDALTWNVDGITRPNSAAWYVCEGQKLYVNLGAYLYDTPAGCADETIHYYNGATAVS